MFTKRYLERVVRIDNEYKDCLNIQAYLEENNYVVDTQTIRSMWAVFSSNRSCRWTNCSLITLEDFLDCLEKDLKENKL